MPMTRLSFSERTRIALLAADRSRRAMVSRTLYSPFVRWRYGSSVPGQLLIVPQDLRTADPSFWQEFQLKQFGLAGTIAVLGKKSPFELKPPNEAWARSLHGFSWLRHLEAAGEDDAQVTARQLAVEWTIRQRAGAGIAWEPGVMGRRLISWISHAPLLLEGADEETYDAIARSLSSQLVRLSASWRDGPDGYPRLVALIALVLADLSIDGHDRRLAEAEQAFATELSRQILADGGHVSRNPGVLVELMLDLLPLRQCFASRGRQPPEALNRALQGMHAMLRYMRLGDGMLARFNGMAVASPAGLATVLAYGDQSSRPLESAADSAYARLSRGSTVLVADTGAPPPYEMAGEAHAGCLSFEMSAGSRLIFVNGGAPGSADHDWRPTSRATASHNTLCLGETSSSKLIRHALLEEIIGAAPIRGPSTVKATLEEKCGDLELTASHDGYQDRFGLLHRRTIRLSSAGDQVAGVDTLEGAKRSVRLRADIPFAIHFHLHPDVTCRSGDRPGTAELRTRDGKAWSFAVEGANLTIEESTFFADSSGPRAALQFVARGTTFGETEVRWALDARA